jgi:TonB family protein
VELVVAVAMPVVGRFPEPARAQPADVRVLTLRIVAEEMYRARPGWEAELRRTVKTVSDIYERAFQIRVVIVPVALWQRLTDKVPTAPPLPPPCGDAAGPAIDLDRPDSASRAYVTTLRERIRAHHVYPRPAAERRQGGELQVELQIARSGRLDCAALRRSSGSEILDRYIMDAVRLAQPFAPIPSYMPQPSLTLSGVFRYRVVSEPDALPPPPTR